MHVHRGINGTVLRNHDKLRSQLGSKFVSNSMFLSQNHDRKLETLSNVLEKIKPVSYMSSVIVLDEIQQPEVHFGDKCF